MDLLKLCLCVPAVALLLYTGLRLSFVSRWIQIRRLPAAVTCLFHSKGKNFTSLSALCAIVGGNLGVGNLSGTAVALKSGGPGFIIWMVLIIIVTSVIKYVTCYVSIASRVKIDGRIFGGPVVYLQQAFGTRWASIIAAVVTAVCAITVGNLVQVNSLSVSMDLIGLPPIVGGLLMLIALIYVSVGNHSVATKTVARVVPFMTISYLVLSAIALSKFSGNIVPAIKLIASSACDLESFRNGAIIAFIAETFAIIQVGALRGIFATDIGLGLEGTVHSMVRGDLDSKKFAAQQGLVSLISPFIVAVVTTVTTLVLLTTNVWTDPSLESTNMCFTAFYNALGGASLTKYSLILLVFCFSFTTILAWLLCSREAVSYIFHRSVLCEKIWCTLFVAVIPVGSVCAVSILWDIADLAISTAIIVNTIGALCIFSKHKDMFARAYELK